MIYFVDGFQGVGKTALIDLYCKNHPDIIQYKFEFSDIFSNILKSNDIIGFQTGKDFSCISLLKKLHNILNNDMLIDRGFISSCIYSLLLNRMSINQIENYIKLISEYITNDMKFIVVQQSNRSKLFRKHNDGFDNLESQVEESNKTNIMNKIIQIFKSYNININLFTNDFDYSIEDNYKKFTEVFH